MRWRYIFAVLLLTALPLQGPAWDSKPKPWDELKGCRLMKNWANDGDSFHVMHHGKEYIFRLCFVDCPETSDMIPTRVRKQGQWWGIDEDAVIQMGHEASRFTKGLLKEDFTVFTRYEDARGRSALKRNFAMVQLGDGFLSEALVQAGLARTYGYAVVTPQGQSARAFRDHLDKLERKARKGRKGAWATTGLKPTRDDGEEQEPGRTMTLTRTVPVYGDGAVATFRGNLKPGTVVFVPDEQPGKSRVRIRAPLRGKVMYLQCHSKDLPQSGK